MTSIRTVASRSLKGLFVLLGATLVVLLFMAPSGMLPLLICTNYAISGATEDLVEAELEIGSTSNDVETFFVRHDISFSYNQFSNKFHGIIRDVDNCGGLIDQATSIDLFLDDEHRLERIAVHDSFTWL